MEIREYIDFNIDEIRRLSSEVGWTAYTENMPALEQGYKNSMTVLAAYEDDELLGIIRTVGDGFTIVFIQDILVFPEKQRLDNFLISCKTARHFRKHPRKLR